MKKIITPFISGLFMGALVLFAPLWVAFTFVSLLAPFALIGLFKLGKVAAEIGWGTRQKVVGVASFLIQMALPFLFLSLASRNVMFVFFITERFTMKAIGRLTVVVGKFPQTTPDAMLSALKR